MGRLLLHVCCANCLADVLPAATGYSDALSILFYNPNIQPLVEYRRRRKSTLLLARILKLDVVDSPPVNAHPCDFLGGTVWQGSARERCATCYRMRLERTAATAEREGFEAFSTTLLVSRMQHRDGILAAGRSAAETFGVRFLENDWRELHGSARGLPPSFQPYRQQYCGCIFSEYERFSPGGMHLLPDDETGHPT
ncbi:MAG: epoxyqueuosine reductase QueH [Planctomycetes bacterium]|nr:epoxyqueuosine reductase QueH [Planctomycetota bacterium]